MCVLESTCYTESVWLQANIENHAKAKRYKTKDDAMVAMANKDDGYDEKQQLLSTDSSQQQVTLANLDRVFRLKMPLAHLVKTNFYANAYHMLTSDYVNPKGYTRAMHLLLRDKNDKNGVSLLQLSNNAARSKELLKLNQGQLGEFKRLLLSEFPPARVPTNIIQSNSNSNNNYLHTHSVAVNYFVRKSEAQFIPDQRKRVEFMVTSELGLVGFE